MRWSALDQIDRSNVAHLEEAWRIRTGDLDVVPPPPGHMAFQATPILVDDLLVLPTPMGRVLALDPETGAERWRFDATAKTLRGARVHRARRRELDGRAGAPRRGLPAPHLRDHHRVASVCDRRRERPRLPGFRTRGRGGSARGRRRRCTPWEYTISSPPTLVGDLVIVGSAIADNRRVDMPKGIVRAYDARSGALRWAWDPIPRSADDPAHAEWRSEQAARVGAANAWSILSADPARDLVFVPTSSPSPDYFGGERLGSNRYANSVVALRASSGRVVWSFQVVHHDLWDYDVPAQPVLTSLMREGREIPVVVQATKMGHLFVLHRETGVPIFPVEERPVPASDVPGEQASPTQPFPTAPPALVPQALAPERGLGSHAAGTAAAAASASQRLRNEGIFTPPSLRGTLTIPGNAGGSNWGSIAIDPTRRLALLNLTNLAFEVRLIPRADFEREKAAGSGLLGLREFAPQAGTPYGMVREPLLSPLQLPCNPPPWGTFAAVSLDDGRVLWQVPLGSVPDRLRVPLPVTIGLPNLGGPIATAGGLAFVVGRDGRRAARLRRRDRRRAVERPSPGRRQRHAHDLPRSERPPVRADRRRRSRQARHAARRLGGGLRARGSLKRSRLRMANTPQL